MSTTFANKLQIVGIGKLELVEAVADASEVTGIRSSLQHLELISRRARLGAVLPLHFKQPTHRPAHIDYVRYAWLNAFLGAHLHVLGVGSRLVRRVPDQRPALRVVLGQPGHSVDLFAALDAAWASMA